MAKPTKRRPRSALRPRRKKTVRASPKLERQHKFKTALTAVIADFMVGHGMPTADMIEPLLEEVYWARKTARMLDDDDQ